MKKTGGRANPAAVREALTRALEERRGHAVIEFYHVSKKYGTFRDVLNDISFRVDSGEFVFLTGPSGAGKTTLLRLLFREEPPTAGQIIVNGRNVGVLPQSQIPYLRRTMGIVFQDYKLLAAQDRLRERLLRAELPRRSRAPSRSGAPTRCSSASSSTTG